MLVPREGLGKRAARLQQGCKCLAVQRLRGFLGLQRLKPIRGPSQPREFEPSARILLRPTFEGGFENPACPPFGVRPEFAHDPQDGIGEFKHELDQAFEDQHGGPCVFQRPVGGSSRDPQLTRQCCQAVATGGGKHDGGQIVGVEWLVVVEEPSALQKA